MVDVHDLPQSPALTALDIAHPENMACRLQIFRLGLDITEAGRIDQHCNRRDPRHQFVQQRKALCGDVAGERGEAGEIAGRTIEARHEAKRDGVATYSKNDGDGLGRGLGG